jgi:hypothetical protein
MRVETRLCWLIVSSIIAASLCRAQEPGSRLDDANAVAEPSLQEKADGTHPRIPNFSRMHDHHCKSSVAGLSFPARTNLRMPDQWETEI